MALMLAAAGTSRQSHTVPWGIACGRAPDTNCLDRDSRRSPRPVVFPATPGARADGTRVHTISFCARTVAAVTLSTGSRPTQHPRPSWTPTSKPTATTRSALVSRTRRTRCPRRPLPRRPTDRHERLRWHGRANWLFVPRSFSQPRSSHTRKGPAPAVYCPECLRLLRGASTELYRCGGSRRPKFRRIPTFFRSSSSFVGSAQSQLPRRIALIACARST